MTAVNDDSLFWRKQDFQVGASCPIFVSAGILKPDQWGKSRVVSGRGTTRKEARERCWAEGVERACAIFDEAAGVVRRPWEDIKHEAIRPSTIHLISERQFQGRIDWNARVDADHRLPAPFDEGRPTGWV